MLYRTVPKNGDELSILGFGCMRLPLTKERQIDEPRAIRQIRDAIDRGVNYLDTAWPYHAGESENVLGRALSDGYRARVKIATKLPSWMIKNREDMDFYLNAQLEKLKTDHIDYYLIHGLAGDLWDRLVSFGVPDFLDQARADGRIINAVEAKFSYALSMSGAFSGILSYASQCVRCEECLEKCPQHIEIPDLLELVAEEMEDEELENRIAIGKKMLNME